MIRSWLLRALFAIALVLMIALALVTALLATEPGQSLVIGTAEPPAGCAV